MTAATRGPARGPLRLRTAAEIVAAVPHLCGYVPSESLVAVSLRGPRRTVGLTLRLDLPRTARTRAAAVDQVVRRLLRDGAQGSVFVLYTEDGRCGALAAALRAAAARAHLDVGDVLLVQDGRWWSLACDRPGCCPPEGTPLLPRPTAATASLAAAVAFDGRAVLASRAELAASLAPPADGPAAQVRGEAAAAASQAEVQRKGRGAVRREVVGAFEAATTGPRPGDTRDLAMLVALQDVQIRDEVVTLALDRAAELLAVLLGLARVSVGEWDPPVCTLVAVVAWLRGDGALANVALDRALAADPGYPLALLIRAGLDGQLPPAVVRHWLLATRAQTGAA